MDRTLIPNLQPKQGEKMDMRVVKTREAIAEAFVQLLETTEYTDITVTAIAREARISRKTFYLHYSSTDELLRELVKGNIEEMAAEIDVENLGGSASDTLREFTVMVLGVLRDHPYLNSNLIHCMPLNSFLGMAREPLIALITDHFEKHGIDRPPFFDYWVSYYLGGLCSAYETWKVTDGDPATLDQLSDTIGKSVATTFELLMQEYR